MAVYERAYRGYHGPLTPVWSRFLIIPRFAYQQVFASKLLTGFFAACLLFPVGAAATIYLMNNLSALAELGIPIETTQTLELHGWHALLFLRVQGVVLGSLLTLVVAPPLISADMRNNGLALYLSRPMTRREYVLGKMTVLLILLSAITWVPGLLLFALQAYLAGRAWLADHWTLSITIPLAGMTWIVVLTLVALAVSALVRLKTLARAMLFAILFLSGLPAQIINGTFSTRWGELVALSSLIDAVWGGLLGAKSSSGIPAGIAWAMLAAIAAASLALLARRIRAYEVVR